MCSKKIKLKLSGVINKNIFGFRNKDSEWYIGISHITFEDDAMTVENEKYLLTDGLLSLLADVTPEKYTAGDLEQYKEILQLTNAHKWGFSQKKRICSNKSWKYKNIISKLFPPKKCINLIYNNNDSEEHLHSSYKETRLEYIDANDLVEQFKILNNRRPLQINKINRILHELQQLGIIDLM